MTAPFPAVFSDSELAAALEPGEHALWQGRPAPGGAPPQEQEFWRLFGAIMLVVGLGFLPFGLAFPQIRLVFVPLSALLTAGALACLILPARIERRRVAGMRYLLTDRRALVETEGRLRAWPISPHLIIEQSLGSPGSIVFDRVPLALTVNDQTVTRNVGFINIAEAEEIAQIIRRLQAALQAAPARPNPKADA